MGDKEIVVELQAVLPGICLTNAVVGDVDNRYVDETYKIGQMCIYSSRYMLKSGMVDMAAKLYN